MATSFAYACTGDGTCETDCPAPPSMGLANRPWCAPFETGTINVTTNVATNWWVAGPVSYGGSGTNQSQFNQPVGMYTITWATVNGYTSPSSQTLTLANQGDSITFVGNFTANPPSVNLYFSLLYDAMKDFFKNL